MEERKDIPWYDWFYQVSTLWRMISKKNNKIKILTPYKRKDWYVMIWISHNSKKRTLKTARLIALTFISNPENKPCVNHIDWDKSNNTVENLEWVTYSENERHSYDILWKKLQWSRLGRKWFDNYSSKTTLQLDLEWNIIKERWSTAVAAENLWLSYWNIGMVCRWERKTTWWYKRKYK